jgi:hypothetical protein
MPLPLRFGPAISSPNRAAFRAWLVAMCAPLLCALLYYSFAGDYDSELARFSFWTVPFGLYVGLLVRAAAFPTLVGATPLRRALVVGATFLGAIIFAVLAEFPFGAWAGPFGISATLVWGLSGALGALYAVLLGSAPDPDQETPPSVEPAARIWWTLMRWSAPFALLIALKSSLSGVPPFDYSNAMSIPMASRLPPGSVPADTPRQTVARASPDNSDPTDSMIQGSITPEDSARAYDGMYLDDDSLTVANYRLGFAICHGACSKPTGVYLLEEPSGIVGYHPAAQLDALGKHVRMQTGITIIGTIRVDGYFTVGPDEFPDESKSGEPVFEGSVTVERNGATVYSGSHRFVFMEEGQ